MMMECGDVDVLWCVISVVIVVGGVCESDVLEMCVMEVWDGMVGGMGGKMKDARV